MSQALPPLPRAATESLELPHRVICAVFDPSPGRCDCGAFVKGYTAEQMQAYALAACEAVAGALSQIKRILPP